LKDEGKIKLIFVNFLDVIKPQVLSFQNIKQPAASSAKPVAQRIRKINEEEQQTVREETHKLLKADHIREIQ